MVLQNGADVSTKLVNHGTLDIGSTSAGSVLLEEYEQSSGGRLIIGLGGPLPGVDFDQINITKDASLSGKLDVSILGEFTLSPGDSFEIVKIDGMLTTHFNTLNEGALVGVFDDVELFITYFGGDGNDIVLFTKLSGDIDNDNDVDGNDFLIWQRGGSPNPLSSSDLALWQMQYGSSVPIYASATAVPEPTTTMLLMTVGIVVWLAKWLLPGILFSHFSLSSSSRVHNEQTKTTNRW